jgi:hypothetical protein
MTLRAGSGGGLPLGDSSGLAFPSDMLTPYRWCWGSVTSLEAKLG